jgi:ComEC/Rec2-related protein
MSSHTKNYSPLVPLCGFIAGTALGLYLPLPVFMLYAGAATITTSTIFYWQQSPIARVALIALFACNAGYFFTNHHNTIWQEKQIRLMGRPFAIQGYVSDVNPLASRPYLATVTITIESLEQQGNHYTYKNDSLLHYLPYKLAPRVGSAACFIGIKPLKKPPRTEIRAFLQKNKIVHQIFSQHDVMYHNYTDPTAATTLSWWSRLHQWLCCKRAAFYQQATTLLSPVAKIYTGLMFFGAKEPGSDDIRALFGRWGLAHFLARSGMHIVIFVFILSLLLRAIPIHSSGKDIFLLLICIIYDALSWSSVSFLRAWLIAVLIIIKKLLGRNTPYLHFLCLSCIVILAYNPWHLTSLDFQLTYALTFALTIFGDIFTQPKGLNG